MVRIKSVSVSYNGQKALNDVSMDIEKGERLVILGPSGCGKTTILRLIAGFIAPDTGIISIDHRQVARDGHVIIPPEQRNLGMVFQDLALWPHMSVTGNIDFGLKATGIAKAERKRRIDAMLSLTDMTAYATRRPSELSGGQQQRVALARALAPQPKVLLMDEPLSSLDNDLNVRLRKEVVKLHNELGFTLIYVTHDRDEATDIATRVITMKQGRIQEKTDPA